MVLNIQLNHLRNVGNDLLKIMYQFSWNANSNVKSEYPHVFPQTLNMPSCSNSTRSSNSHVPHNKLNPHLQSGANNTPASECQNCIHIRGLQTKPQNYILFFFHSFYDTRNSFSSRTVCCLKECFLRIVKHRIVRKLLHFFVSENNIFFMFAILFGLCLCIRSVNGTISYSFFIIQINTILM